MEDRQSTLSILRDRPEVCGQAGIAAGVLLAAFGLHTWSSTALMAGGVSGMSAADAALYSGICSTTVFLAAALVVGWICGGWILQSAGDQLRRTLRRLAAVGCLLIALMALGAWPLAGGLIMVTGAGAGLIARNAVRDRPRAC